MWEEKGVVVCHSVPEDADRFLERTGEATSYKVHFRTLEKSWDKLMELAQLYSGDGCIETELRRATEISGYAPYFYGSILLQSV